MNRLLQIGIEVNSGSTGRIAEELGEMAMDNGWESYISYARGYNPSKSNVVKVGNKFNIYRHVIQTRLLGNHLLASTKATKALIHEIQILNPDIIHLHQIHGYYLNVKVLFEFLAKLKTPIVWTLHDCWSFTGHCSYFSLIDCNKWQERCYNCPQKRGYPKSFFIDRSESNYFLKKDLFNNLDNLTLITISDWLKSLVKQSFFSNQNVITINNGINTRLFRPIANNSDVKQKNKIPDKKIILGVGTTWIRSKGLYDYYLLNEKISDEYVIVLVGVGQQIIKNLPKGIVGIRRTESIDELAALYSMATVVTSLSYQEAFGLTPAEGFACGTPAIVYNATALPELVTPEVGSVITPGDIDGVWSAIQEIGSKDKAYYTEMCRARAIEKYDSQKRYNDYFSLYENLVTGKQ